MDFAKSKINTKPAAAKAHDKYFIRLRFGSENGAKPASPRSMGQPNGAMVVTVDGYRNNRPALQRNEILTPICGFAVLLIWKIPDRISIPRKMKPFPTPAGRARLWSDSFNFCRGRRGDRHPFCSPSTASSRCRTLMRGVCRPQPSDVAWAPVF